MDCLARPFHPQGHRETTAADIPRVRKRGAADHGRQAGQVHIRAECGRGFGRGRRRGDESRGGGRAAVAEVFSRTTNGCGHRQVAMCLRAELGARIADKTMLKMMREMGIRCGIRRETDYHKHNSYKGIVGEIFENVIGRDDTRVLPNARRLSAILQ